MELMKFVAECNNITDDASIRQLALRLTTDIRDDEKISLKEREKLQHLRSDISLIIMMQAEQIRNPSATSTRSLLDSIFITNSAYYPSQRIQLMYWEGSRKTLEEHLFNAFLSILAKYVANFEIAELVRKKSKLIQKR